ncbi:aldehyde dehydrogenase [Microbacterium pseudoresistens]|uniref:Aldehyde dehydrogenase (NAD+) n=1 Tax=Microbacterium pseudoresistens TaxID=640634 RepID=A0A7Y9EU39_9MICO|nr:aldehyde dehydrogenase [Microbacterium pseudoresistens]NYD53982.1 aldehyde dehydrogenase (NAD+) [Microbacterium pseudoresistens]
MRQTITRDDRSTAETTALDGIYVDGRLVRPDGAQYFDVRDPATGRVWNRALDATAAEVDLAVRSARRAFESEEWSMLRPADRAQLLIDFGSAIADNAEELSDLQVRENGKLMREMFGQTKLMREYFNYYAGLAQLPLGATNATHLRGMVNYTVREPIGVVGAVTPWNSPLLLLVWKLGPALAAGNTVVAKPSEVTPLSTVRLAQIASEVGFPDGVFNVVTGQGAAGRALVEHPEVDKVAFTGSTPTGKAIAASAASRLARVSLELGGKSPNIIFDDADIEAAVTGAVAGIFGASGQTCMAGSRILVQSTVYDEVVERIARRADAIVVGDPREDESQMGAVASRAQYDKVLEYIGIATGEGARLVSGGVVAEVPGLKEGLFVRPTVFADVTNDMRIAREEVFGPIAAIIRFDDEEEAVRIANDTEFGLAAGVWTGSVPRAHRVAGLLRAGTVWVNNYRKTSYATPFGGYKQSGLGRENGIDAMREFSEEKSIWIDAGQGIKDPFNPRA